MCKDGEILMLSTEFSLLVEEGTFVETESSSDGHLGQRTAIIYTDFIPPTP